jgi:ligand-binding sensor domain-containing protein
MLRTISLLVYSILVYQASAQSIVHELLDASRGLSSSECISLAQDFEAHLWVGTTAGISRYNGYTFENFSYANDTERFGKVNVICEDAQHVLWIGTDNGLFIKTQEGVFHKLAGSDSTAQGVNDILFLTNGKILLASEIGPLLFSSRKLLLDAGIKKHALSSFKIAAWESHQFEHNRIDHLSLGADSSIYLSGPYVIYKYHHQSFEQVFEDNAMSSVIMSLCAVNSDRFYFYSGSTGLFRGVGKEITRMPLHDYYHPDATPKGKSAWMLIPIGVIEFYPDSETIRTELDLVSQGILWTSDFLVDHQGDYWLAAHDGLMKIKRSPFKKIPVAIQSYDAEIYAAHESDDGTFLLGSNRGLILEKKANEVSPRYTVVDKAEVFAIHEETPGDLWFATGYQGIVHRVKSKAELFTEKEGLRNNSNNAFFKTSDQRLFVTGDKGATQIIYSPADGKVSFKNFPVKAVNSQYATLFSMIESPDKTLWFAGQEGIFRLKDDSLINYLLDKKHSVVADMKMSSDGTVWVAVSGEGIWRAEFDKNGDLKIKEKFDQRRGMATEIFNRLLIDRNGNVWVSHFLGITVIRKDKKILNYDQHDGWPFKNYNNLFLYQDREQTVWAGCSKGLARFNADALLADSDKPQIFLSASVPSPGHPEESKVIPKNTKLELASDERELTFNYYAIDFPNQEGLRYAYKLGNAEWSDVGLTRSLAFNHLAPGEYTFRVKAFNNKGVTSDEVSMQVLVRGPFWRTPGFIVATLVVLVIVTTLLVRRREKMIFSKEQQKKAREIEMISLHRDLAHSRLIALRSQMNPHFIFNALNSIQQFVLQGNVDEASRYLGVFSLLHREILNTSDENFISLQREIDMLGMYIQLEQLRFDESFSHSIHLDDEIDPEEVEIPPMLIQPFVENAIWHGLMPKAGPKRVEIAFDLIANGDVLVCRIKDNGIGREASAQMKVVNGSLKNHKPKGLKLISDRVGMLQQRYQTPFTLEIADQVEENQVTGTVVTITLSLTSHKKNV